MDTPDALEPPGATSETAKIWYYYLLVGPADYGKDFALPVDKDSYLSACLSGYFCKAPGQFGRQYLIRRGLSPVQPLQCIKLGGF